MKRKFLTGVLIVMVAIAFAIGPATPMTPMASPASNPINPEINQPQTSVNGGLLKISGTISDIIYGNGRRPVELTVLTKNNSEIFVQLGPIWLFNATELVLGKAILVKGIMKGNFIIAYSVVFGTDQLVQLRDYMGFPIWPEGAEPSTPQMLGPENPGTPGLQRPPQNP